MGTKGESRLSSPEGRRRSRDEAPFARECRMALCRLPGSSDLSRPRKELYRELLVGSASDTLNGIGRLARASCTTSFRSPGGLPGTRCPLMTGLSEHASPTCPTVGVAAVV